MFKPFSSRAGRVIGRCCAAIAGCGLISTASLATMQTSGAVGAPVHQYVPLILSTLTATVNAVINVLPPLLPPTMSLRVVGNHFVDAKGAVVQLRGVSFSAFEIVAMAGWDVADPSGGQAGQVGGPKWSAVQAWKANIVRFPMNEASWLGYSCTDTSGRVHDSDPGDNYRAAIKKQVEQANAAGLYVILDLHFAAPGNACPMLQSQMANADHSLAFWSSVASTFKTNPAVMFELFNEPYFNFDFEGNDWTTMMKGTGGSFSGYPATSNTYEWKNVQQPWAVASYQQMIKAVRDTGATNIVLVGSRWYSSELSGWLANKPSDPINQMAAVWHAYPTFQAPLGSAEYAQPNWSPGIFTDVQGILAANIPVIITETGDHNTPGTVGAPLVQTVTQWADSYGVSVLGWTWDVWGEPDNVLIKDVNGTPTDGYGQFFHDWLVNHR